MDNKAKRQVGWAFIATLITISVLIAPACEKKKEEPVKTTVKFLAPSEVPVIEYPTPKEVEEIHPKPEKKAEVETVNVEIQHFSPDGTLIAAYPDYDNFGDAFVYARRTLGHSETTGEVQTFLWRGKKYHTEHKDQLESDSTEFEDPSDVDDTTTVNQ
tara:strand:- start:912 stop:1385 length:474 start_codon:yes stop_codon:yes gene_type:complete